MRCVICERSVTENETATVTMTRDVMTVVVRDVPAKVCKICGDVHVDEKVVSELLALHIRAASDRVQVDVRRYVAA